MLLSLLLCHFLFKSLQRPLFWLSVSDPTWLFFQPCFVSLHLFHCPHQSFLLSSRFFSLFGLVQIPCFCSKWLFLLSALLKLVSVSPLNRSSLKFQYKLNCPFCGLGEPGCFPSQPIHDVKDICEVIVTYLISFLYTSTKTSEHVCSVYSKKLNYYITWFSEPILLYSVTLAGENIW